MSTPSSWPNGKLVLLAQLFSEAWAAGEEDRPELLRMLIGWQEPSDEGDYLPTAVLGQIERFLVEQAACASLDPSHSQPHAASALGASRSNQPLKRSGELGLSLP